MQFPQFIHTQGGNMDLSRVALSALVALGLIGSQAHAEEAAPPAAAASAFETVPPNKDNDLRWKK
jgi:hypothetical protein